MNRRTLKLVAGSTLAIGSAIVAWMAFSSSPALQERNLAIAHKQTFDIKVAVVGMLDASKGYEVVSGLRGDRGKVIKISDDGAQVKKGDVIVSFDPTFFEAEILRLGGEIKSRQSVVEFQRQLLNLERSRVEKDISSSQFELAKIRQESEQISGYLDELRALEKQGYSVSSEIVQAKRKAEESISRKKKAESEIERVQKEAIFKVAQATAELKKSESDLETARIALAEVKAENEKTILRAPIDGFVVIRENNMNTERRRFRMGDTIWQGQPVLYMPDMTSMIVKTEVRENDLNKIQVGLEATVKIDAYPSLTLSGNVESIGSLAVEDPSVAGKHFQFTIKLQESDPRLRPGMTARAFIMVDQVKDTLAIPISALFDDEGSTYCYFKKGSDLLRRNIKIARMNEDLVEVTEGLSEGDRVSLIRP
jgi:HlyD family secretion protein